MIVTTYARNLSTAAGADVLGMGLLCFVVGQGWSWGEAYS